MSFWTDCWKHLPKNNFHFHETFLPQISSDYLRDFFIPQKKKTVHKYLRDTLQKVCKYLLEFMYHRMEKLRSQVNVRGNVMEKKIIIYNDNTGISKKMAPFLKGENFLVEVASSENELILHLQDKKTKLILIDVELGGKGWESGVSLITRLRAISSIPIIVVSCEKSECAKIMALNSGADDYVTADCNPLVLLARIKSQIRRLGQLASSGPLMDGIYRVDGLVVDDTSRKVTVDGREVSLTPIEYKILKLLVQENGKVISVERIYETIWQMRAIGVDNTIAVHIRHIREKIENNPKEPRYVKVVRGTGYKVG